MKYLVALELIMNDNKEKWVSDIPEIESEFSFKTKKPHKNKTKQKETPLNK